MSPLNEKHTTGIMASEGKTYQKANG